MDVSPKVAASTSGVGIAGAITTVAIWIINSKYHIEVPPDVAASITTIVAAFSGAFAGYMVRHTAPDGSV